MLRERGGPAFAAFVFRLSQLARVPGGLALTRALHVVGRDASDEDLQRMLRGMLRLHPATCAALACSAEEHSSAPGLADLRMPLLIMAGELDRFAPPNVVGEPLHRAVPHSVFVRLATATHTALFDHAPQVDQSVTAFLEAMRDSKVEQ
jgi:pimeloyl-ACP methyl ester carboxylesterase